MESVLNRMFALAVELLAGLAAIVGCSKHTEPARPSETCWHGAVTGYQSTTKPADKSNLAAP